MAASISFYAGEGFGINNLSGSGLGFYGTSFGASVKVGEFQDKTFITNSNGTIQGPEADNVKYVHEDSGVIGAGGAPVALTGIPNYQSTLNIRFTNDSSVKVQNVEFRIYDRQDINRPGSGVSVKVAEIIHPWNTQEPTGSGDARWYGTTVNSQTNTKTVGGTGIVVPLANSPGTSGWNAGSGNGVTPDTQHDWYLAISSSPDSIGSKTFAAYIQLEYL